MRRSGWATLLLAVAVGCAGSREQLDQAMHDLPGPTVAGREAAQFYRVRPPDELAIQVAGRPDWSGTFVVGPEGRVELDEERSVRVDGLTPPQAAQALAAGLGLRQAEVSVQVAGYRSQKLYVYGEVPGQEEAVPYHGPETVLDLLRRVGGLPPGAAPTEVRVVRVHVAAGRPPEVFHIDLAGILLRRDLATNVRLEPGDQVHIGQTRSSRLASQLPPWMSGLKRLVEGP